MIPYSVFRDQSIAQACAQSVKSNEQDRMQEDPTRFWTDTRSCLETLLARARLVVF